MKCRVCAHVFSGFTITFGFTTGFSVPIFARQDDGTVERHDVSRESGQFGPAGNGH